MKVEVNQPLIKQITPSQSQSQETIWVPADAETSNKLMT